MTVGLCGTGPARSAIEAALGDIEETTSDVAPEAIDEFEHAAVVAQAGSTAFARANRVAGDGNTRWLAVELGGIGGYPVADAAITGFGPGTACYECLRGRVEANVDPAAEPVPAPPAHTARLAGAIAGRALTRLVSGDSEAALGRVRELPAANRRLLSLPGCECANPPDPSVPLEDTHRALDVALESAEVGLDPRVGIVREVGEAESFPLPYYLATLCETEGFSDGSAPRQAAGVAVDWDTAFMKALGESLERYCAGIYRADSLPSGTPDDLPNAVPPTAFVTPGDGPPGDVTWVTGQNLATGGDVHIPADVVYYPPPSDAWRPAITTGLGLGNSGPEALLSGLYEVIERDATMIAWYSTFDPLGLDISAESIRTIRDRACAEDLDVNLVLLTQDVDVPVVGAAVSRDRWPKLAMGSGANLDVTTAATAALTEALQNWMELDGMGVDTAKQQNGQIGHYAQEPGHAGSFVQPETEVPAASVGQETPPSVTDELTAVVERLTDHSLTPYAVRTTTRDVDSLGFEAVRAIVPSAQPLFFDTAYFGDRARTVPESLGFEPRLDRQHHPFP